ncbi:MAG TPA: TrbG/VirB9 family P-type conjugative transfer protein [Acidobacteriota bacterium]|nr:TrbG/VirB9 family P-type conjugative transfer protein [Acidobacteriota bacterium]
MKQATLWILAVLLSASAAAITPRTVECNFDGANRNKVYSLTCSPGVGTTFRLPDGWEIQDFVVTDSKNWFGQSNGTVGIVKPLEPDQDTAVVISTPHGQCFVFHLSSRPAEDVAALVVVDVHDANFFQSRVSREAAQLIQQKSTALEKEYQGRLEKETGEARKKLLFSLETRYQVKNDQFLIQKAVDDGIFTYVLMPYAQERPAVFVAERNKDKELQPVKYVDLGEYYQIHRVLSGNERFFLKSGDKTTIIGRE